MITNQQSFSDRINNLHIISGVKKDQLQQRYILDRFMHRLAMSEYRDNFVLKGGSLIAGIIEVSNRATKDIDSDVIGIDFSEENIKQIFEDICKRKIEGEGYKVKRIEPILEQGNYPGLRVFLQAKIFSMVFHFHVDVSTGHSIIPAPLEMDFNVLLTGEPFSLLTAPLETILAEKLESIYSRSVVNTRARDFYDIYILVKLKRSEIGLAEFRKAVTSIFAERGSELLLVERQALIDTIKGSEALESVWEKYRKLYLYSNDINFSDTTNAIEYLDSLL